MAPRNRTHKPDLALTQYCASICVNSLPKFDTDGKLHLEGRTLADRRLDPNAAAVHLHDLLGDCEPEAGATLGLSKGAVDLVELLEHARLLFVGYPRSGVGNADSKVPIGGGRNNAYLAGIRKLDGITDEVE